MPESCPKQRRVLAFDFGTKRIGIAVGQELTGTATALAPISAVNGIPDWDTLSSLIAQWQPDAFVVGIPLHMDDSEGGMALRAQKFCRRLQGRFHRPSYGMDERLSSVAARTALAQGQRKGGQPSIDSYAAKLILESWFREQASPQESNSENSASQ